MTDSNLNASQLYQRGLELFRQGEFREALKHWEAVRMLDPDWPNLDISINVCERQKVRQDFQMDGIDDMLRGLDGQDVRIVDRVSEVDTIVQAAIRAAKPTEAEIALEGLRQDRPRDEKVLAYFVRASLRLGNLHRAITVAKELVQCRPYSYKSHLLLGRVQFLQEDYDSALQSLLRANSLKPDQFSVLAYLGVVSIHLQRLADAESWLRKAHDIRPDDQRVIRQIEQVMQQQEQIEEDFSQPLAVLEAKPDFPDVLFRRAQIYLRLGFRDKAYQALEGALKQNPDYVQALCEMGRIAYEDQKYKLAVDMLVRAANLMEIRQEIMANVQNFERSGYHEEAAVELLRVLKPKPDFGSFHIDLGRQFFQSGNLKAAIEELQKAVSMAPAYADGHFWLGRSLEKMGELQRAKGHFQEAWTLNPFYSEAGFCYVDILMIEGELELARQVLLRMSTCVDKGSADMQKVQEYLERMQGLGS